MVSRRCVTDCPMFTEGSNRTTEKVTIKQARFMKAVTVQALTTLL